MSTIHVWFAFMCNVTRSTIAGNGGSDVTIFNLWICHDHFITADPCCVLCLAYNNNALFILINNNDVQYVTTSDSGVYLKTKEFGAYIV
jgi:hypothetical protein